MLACPACKRPGIFEHSVSISWEEVRGRQEGDAMPVYSRCVACKAVFARGAHGEFGAQLPAGPDAHHVWIAPPWKKPGDEAQFEMSWDVVQAFFERLALKHAFVRPIYELIGALRDAGFGARLRAGQSVSSLGLSRAREHGLRPDQSHLFLHPQPDGTIRVRGRIGPIDVDFGPVSCVLAGELHRTIHALADVPID